VAARRANSHHALTCRSHVTTLGMWVLGRAIILVATTLVTVEMTTGLPAVYEEENQHSDKSRFSTSGSSENDQENHLDRICNMEEHSPLSGHHLGQS
jgi:hypothetical protein